MDTYIWRILIVDDDEDDYYLTKEMLLEIRDCRFVLEWAKSQTEGAFYLDTESYDAVLVDYDLGCDQGTDLIRASIAAGCQAPMILLSGRDSFEIDLAAMRAGAADYLCKKDINPRYLERAIRYAIEHKRTEAMLRESEACNRQRLAELQALMNAVPAILWVSRDSQCREMECNQYGLELLRLPPGANVSKSAPEAEVQRQSYQAMKNGNVLNPSEMPMQVAAATGAASKNYEFDVVFPDGETINLIGNVEPVRDEHGNPCGAVAAFLDISHHKQVEAERDALKGRLNPEL